MKNNFILYSYVYFSDLQFLQQQTLPFLPLVELKKLSNTKNRKKALLSLAGKYLLKTGLELHHMDPSRIKELEWDNDKRPFIANCFDFNITHSENFVACAFSSEGRVGLDIELIKPKLPGTLSIFSAKDQELIRGAEDQVKTFYKLWTKREAVSKADGRGFKLPGKDINIDKNFASIKNGKLLKLYPLEFKNDYVGTLACEISISKEFKITKVNVLASNVSVLV